MPKKTPTAKRKATKTPTKRGPGRPKGTKNVKKPAAKKVGGNTRQMNPVTGFAEGSDQDVIATALLEGGESRSAIVENVESQVDLETRNGTDKQITNMVSGVLAKMKDRGFIVESSFVLLPPTPASKRAATRAKNAKAPPAKKKSVAKKTVAKKGKAARRRK
jgi:hypothetical protein